MRIFLISLLISCMLHRMIYLNILKRSHQYKYMSTICRGRNKRTLIIHPRYLHKLRVSKRHQPPSSTTPHERISTWSILDTTENKRRRRQPCPSSCLRYVAFTYRRTRPSRRRPQAAPFPSPPVFLHAPPDIQLNLTGRYWSGWWRCANTPTGPRDVLLDMQDRIKKL